MVSTRAMKARSSSFVEEKKDDDGYLFTADQPLPQSPIHGKVHDLPKNIVVGVAHASDRGVSSPNVAPRSRKSPLLLLLCASGITSCYLWYGMIQERIFHMDNTSDEGDGGSRDGDKESITLFLLATGTFSSFLLAMIWALVGPILLSSGKNEISAHGSKSIAGGRLNHPLILVTSLTYLSAMAASNESLHYVSYPTCVLAKSAKLIPTMVVGWLVDTWRNWKSTSRGSNGSTNGSNHHGNGNGGINATEWIGAALITVGIVSFQYIQLYKQSSSGSSHHGGTDDKGDSPYGLVLLGLSLFMDGLLGACQSSLKQKDATKKAAATSTYRPPSAMETMMYINLYATIILLSASHHVGQLQRGMDIMLSNDRTRSTLLLQLNLSASLGQVFIFLTIHHFSPLTCTTITTTRKFFTILLSVHRFGHVLDAAQWAGVGLVFGGLYLQIVAKLFERNSEGASSSVEKEKKE